jgi:aminoglycoside phosphotransferase (APT) family kinase protein
MTRLQVRAPTVRQFRDAEAAYRRYTRHLNRCPRCVCQLWCEARDRLGARWQVAERLAGRRFAEVRTA